jgi:hypothetical protein
MNVHPLVLGTVALMVAGGLVRLSGALRPRPNVVPTRGPVASVLGRRRARDRREADSEVIREAALRNLRRPRNPFSPARIECRARSPTPQRDAEATSKYLVARAQRVRTIRAR